jgi:hypothetical protein
LSDSQELDDTSSPNVSLTSQELAIVARVMSKILAVPEQSDRAKSIENSVLACRLYEARRNRRHFLPENLFADPAWDMLLLLYCLQSSNGTISVTGLCASAGVPMTTALRWLKEVERRALVRRVQNPSDRRSHFINLTEHGKEKMDAYFEYVRKRTFDLPPSLQS